MNSKKQDTLNEHYLLPLVIGIVFVLLILLLYFIYILTTEVSNIHFESDAINFVPAGITQKIVLLLLSIFLGCTSLYFKKRWFNVLYLLISMFTILFII